jgi:hypothetical protein
MPLKNYDKDFGGKKGSAAKAHRAMVKTYGKGKKAEEVFYATKNRNKTAIKGSTRVDTSEG